MLGTHQPTQVFSFSSAADLANHLSGLSLNDCVKFQNAITKRLEADPDVETLRENRALISDLHHFRTYRGRKADRYHAAARADAAGIANTPQKRQVAGLDSEIANSRILLQPGQVVLHGRCDDDLVTQNPYTSFVSTSLNAVVARNSAFRRSGPNKINGRPLVFVLTLRVPLRALWGQVGNSVEWELLLPRNVTWHETGRTTGTFFDVVEAEAL